MAGSTFSRVKTWIAEILTHTDLNAEFDNILTNFTPAGMDDASATDAAMQTATDPYPAAAISKPTDLTGEIQRLRYLIKQLSGETYWYVDPSNVVCTLLTTAGDIVYASAANTLARVSRGMDSLGIINLKVAVNATVNKLDIFSKSGGAVPASGHEIIISIPDGNGHTYRSRAAAYLSGTSQFILADATNYWSKGDLAAEIKTAYVYAIWDGTGIVWALGGYSGFTRVPASTTEGDDDFFLLEASSTYTKVVTDYCVAVAKVRYEYDTGDAPDHTFQATVIDAPQVMWNPKSDYGYTKTLTTTTTSAGNIAEASVVSLAVKQSGKFLIETFGQGNCSTGASTSLNVHLKTGSGTYASATYRFTALRAWVENDAPMFAGRSISMYLNVGDYIHIGASLSGASGNRSIYGDSTQAGATGIAFNRID